MTYETLIAIAYGMACQQYLDKGDRFATAKEFALMTEDHYMAYEVVKEEVIKVTGYYLERGGVVCEY